VEPLLKAKDMADQNVEHLGVMAYAAYFQWVKPRPQVSEQVSVHIDSTSARVHQPVSYLLKLLSFAFICNYKYSPIKIFIIYTMREKYHHNRSMIN
jgi:hypothetical protein